MAFPGERFRMMWSAALHVCVFAVLFCCHAEAAVIDQAAGREYIALNADEADAILDPDGNGAVWTVVADGTALDATALAAPAQGGMTYPPYQSIAVYRLRFSESGTYRFYYRSRNNGVAGHAGSDSFWRPAGFGVDPALHAGTGTTGAYVWTPSGDYVVGPSDLGQVLEFRVAVRESYARLDSLVFSRKLVLSVAELDNLCSPLRVANAPATDVTSSSARLRGELLSNRGNSSEVRIYWGAVDGGIDPLAWQHVERLGVLPVGIFETGITGLGEGATVHYRGYSSNTLETAWAPGSAWFQTATTISTPSIATLPVGTIFDTAARLRGQVLSIGGQRPEVRVYYGKSDGGASAAGWEAWRSLGLQSEGECSLIVDGLATDTQHYYRFRATNTGGDVWAPSSAAFHTDTAYVHPRLLFRPEDMADMRARRFTTHAREWALVVQMCDEVSRSARPAENPLEPDDTRAYEYDLEALALAQAVDPALPYYDTLMHYFWTVLRWPQWYDGGGGIRGGVNADLDVDHNLRALAVTYDWHYANFTWEEREEIRSRLVDYMDIHYNWYSPLWRDVVNPDALVQNHEFNAYGCLAAVAYGVDGVPPAMRDTWHRKIQDRFTSTTAILNNFMADGANNEGPPYHTYGLIQLELWYEIMRSAIGMTDATLYEQTPWLRNTTLFELYSMIPGGTDNYGGVTPVGDGPPYFYYSPLYIEALLARRLRNPLAQWMANGLEQTVNTGSYRLYRFLWHDPTVPMRSPATLPNWHWFDRHGEFIWRSSWENDATHFYIRSGMRYSGHCQPDTGQFLIHRAGVPYVVDLGYATPKHTNEHNVLLVNGSGQVSEGKVWGNYDTPAPWPMNASIWGRMPHVLAEGKEYETPGVFFDVLCDPEPSYTTDVLTQWNREAVGLGDLFLVRDEVAASQAVDFDLLVHAYKSEASGDSWEFTSRAAENPWTALGAARWRIDGRASAPGLLVADVSADAWTASIVATYYSPHNDALAETPTRLGNHLMRRRNATTGSSLLVFGFEDQTGGWTLAPWGDAQAEGVHATLPGSGAKVSDAFWPRNGAGCSVSDGWTLSGRMGARHYGAFVNDPNTGYMTREATLLRDGATTLVLATAPVSVLAHLESAPTADRPQRATVRVGVDARVTLYAPHRPMAVFVDGTSVPFAYLPGQLSVDLAACEATTISRTIEVREVYGAPVFAQSTFDMPGATEDAPYAASLTGQAADPTGETLAYSKVSGPGWLTVTPAGAMAGVPSNADVGASSYTIRATDPGGLFAQATMCVAVANTNDAPVFSVDPMDRSPATIGAPYAASIAGTASDPDVGDVVWYEKVSGPVWIAVSTAGELSGTPSVADVGLDAFTVRANDPAGAHADATLRIVVQNIKYVRSGASGDGSSWATAAGIDSVRNLPAGVAVWLAGGTYSPGNTIYLSASQTWVGGFPPTGNPAWSDRDTAHYVTALDGGGVRDPVFYAQTGDDSVRLDGLVIQHARRAVRVDQARGVTLANCTIRDNESVNYGVGLYQSGYSDVRVENCWFNNNHGQLPTGYGAALYMGSGASANALLELTVVDSKFCINRTEATYDWRSAAVVQSAGNDGVARFDRCMFVGNRTNLNGAVQGDRYGTNRYAFTNCVFSGNYADKESGVNYGLSSSRSPVTFLNCTFGKNGSASGAGALHLRSDMEKAVNCIFSENYGPGGVAVDLIGGGYLAHCLFHGSGTRTLFGGPGSLPEIYAAPGVDPHFVSALSGAWTVEPEWPDGAASVTLLVCVTADWPPGELMGRVINPNDSQNMHTLIIDNTTTSILLVGGGLGARAGSGFRILEYDLALGSPAMDAGDDGAVSGLTPPSEDMRGLSRPADGNGDGLARVDMGAYEAADAPTPTPAPTSVATPTPTGSPTPVITPSPTPTPNPGLVPASAGSGWRFY